LETKNLAGNKAGDTALERPKGSLLKVMIL